MNEKTKEVRRQLQTSSLAQLICMALVDPKADELAKELAKRWVCEFEEQMHIRRAMGVE